jgi:hypothetical protein
MPRVARLMALALRFEEQVRTGVLASYRQLAELGHVSRARVSQSLNLVNLACRLTARRSGNPDSEPPRV